MKRLVVLVSSVLCLGVGLVAYTQIMSRFGSGTPPSMMSAMAHADLIRVDKSERTLTLMQGDHTIAIYEIALGGNPIGHKQFEGDEKTPEGLYTIDWRNQNSIAHLSLHISYPNQSDIDFAAIQNRSAGGNIMIHGMLNGWGWLGTAFQYFDWTNGCIAVSNEDIKEIWQRVPNGTKIEITA